MSTSKTATPVAEGDPGPRTLDVTSLHDDEMSAEWKAELRTLVATVVRETSVNFVAKKLGLNRSTILSIIGDVAQETTWIALAVRAPRLRKAG